MAVYRKLGRVTSHRNLMLRNLTTDVLRYGRIQTTETRAKETKRMVDKMVTLGKRGDLASRRRAMAYILDEDVVKELFDNIGPSFDQRQGGYTRIYKLVPRRGDAAPMAILELIDEENEEAK